MEKPLVLKTKDSNVMSKFTRKEIEPLVIDYFNGDTMAADVWINKYCLKDSESNLYEITPDDMHWRLAKELARIENKYPNPLSVEKIHQKIKGFKKIVPQGSPMAGIGNDFQVTSIGNCFVIGNESDSYGSIMKIDEEQIQLMKRRGGVGHDLSHIRPKDSRVNNSAKTSTGIVPFMERYSNSTREVAQCLHESTLVLTKKGIKKISEINNGDYVWTENEWVLVVDVLKNKKKTYKIKTKFGNEIIASKDHVFHTMNGEKKLEEFSIDDQITMIWGKGYENKEYVKLIKPNYDDSGNRLIKHNLPNELNSDLGYLLGYMYGDGSFDKKISEKTNNVINTEISLACALDRPEIIEKLKEIWFNIFGCELNEKENDGAWLTLRKSSQQIHKFLLHNEIAKQKAGELIFPEKIINSPKDVQLAFISGYFDADGYASDKKKGYVFTSIDKEFLLNIKYILSSFGILSKLHVEDRSKKNWQNKYSLCIVGANSKTKLFNELTESLKLQKATLSAGRDCFLSNYKRKDLIESNTIVKPYIPDNTQYLSTNVLRRLNEDNVEVKNTNPVLYQDYIKEISEYESESNVYDLVLVDTHLFWANGFYAHNSGRRGALMLSIDIAHPESENFIDAKLEKGMVTGANISVKIGDSFMKAVQNNSTFRTQYPIKSKTPKVIKEINANKLWKKIIHNAWKSAEPGILFFDNILRESIPSCYGVDWVEKSTNPCFPSSEYLLTENGYSKFGDLVLTKKDNVILCDKRISYVDEGKENPDNWKIDNNAVGVIKRNASNVFLTQRDAEIIEITTSKGFKVKCTPEHLIATTIGMIEAIDLTPEHEILISIPNINNDSIVNIMPKTNDEIIALLIGLVCGDGAFDKNRGRVHFEFWGDDRFRMESVVKNLIDILYESLGEKTNKLNRKLSKYFSSYDEKNNKTRISSAWVAQLFDEYGYNHKTKQDIPEFIMNNSAKNIGKYFVAGLMYCDGSIQGTHKNGFSVRLSQSNLPLLEKVQKILHSNGMIFGIYKRRDSKLTDLPNGKGGYSKYKTKTQYELISLAGAIVKYRESIGFIGDPIKEEKMMVNHKFIIKKSFVDSIVSTKKCDNEPVFCLKEDIGRNIIVNGISARRCGELPLPPHDSCRLLAINLFGYVINPFTKDAYFDWEQFEEDVIIAERLMDDIVDLELEKIDIMLEKIKNDPEPEYIKNTEYNLWKKIRYMAEQGRRTGLGITGEGDMLAALGITYGSDKGNDFSEEVHKILKLKAYESSVIMAEERGSFPIFDAKREVKNPFILRIKDEAPELWERMQKYGRRNIALLTIAPTGSVSMLTQTTSGIENAFLIYYIRRRKINPQEEGVRVDFVDEQGDKWTEYPVFHHNFELWMKINGYDVYDVKNNWKKEQVDELITKSPYHNATSKDVDWIKKVEMQGRIQKHVDHSISVTVNLPKDASEETVSKVYQMGYDVGCKGITVYRDGSRDGVLITESQKKQKEEEQLFKDNHAPKRPKRLDADIVRFQNNLEKWVAVVGKKEGRPYELFTGRLENGLSKLPTSLTSCEVVKNKVVDKDGNKKSRYDIEYVDNNGEKQVHTGLNHTFNPEFWNIAKTISAVLRHGMPIIFAIELIDSLNLDGSHLNTWKAGVIRVLKKYINNGEAKGACPSCGSDSLEYVEGCLTCKNCGSGNCG